MVTPKTFKLKPRPITGLQFDGSVASAKEISTWYKSHIAQQYPDAHVRTNIHMSESLSPIGYPDVQKVIPNIILEIWVYGGGEGFRISPTSWLTQNEDGSFQIRTNSMIEEEYDQI